MTAIPAGQLGSVDFGQSRAIPERMLERDRLYVMDRGYAKFALLNAIVKKSRSFVCV